MKREVFATGKTVEEAIANGIRQYGLDENNVIKEVVERPKKGLLGIGSSLAKVKLIYSQTPADIALDFVKNIVDQMGLDLNVEMDEKDKDGGRVIRISGEKSGVLIGRHGDTLDAFQYLVNLAANKKEEGLSRDYTKIYLDIENYRDKREETLKALARRMAAKVLRTRRNMTLEPMNPYERRIIHSEIQGIEGVTTVSIGVENNRRVVISLDEKSEGSYENGHRRNRRGQKVSETDDAPEEKEPGDYDDIYGSEPASDNVNNDFSDFEKLSEKLRALDEE